MSARRCPNPLCVGAQVLEGMSHKGGVLTRKYKCQRCGCSSIARGSLPEETSNP
jgi:hypothetical protein